MTQLFTLVQWRQGSAYRPRGRAVWRAFGLEFEFIQVQTRHFFGFQESWVSQWHRAFITDLERTVLDLFAKPDIFGSLQTALETLEMHLDRLDVHELVAYALQYDVGAVLKRLGWELETVAVPQQAIAPLLAYPLRADSQLDATCPPGGTPITRWRLRNNLPMDKTNAHR